LGIDLKLGQIDMASPWQFLNFYLELEILTLLGVEMEVTWEQKYQPFFLISWPIKGNLEIATVAPHLFDQASK